MSGANAPDIGALPVSNYPPKKATKSPPMVDFVTI